MILGRLQFVEAELKLTEISIQSGLQPGGSRGFVFNLVNGMKGVSIDGFVQRIHICDLKVVLRGTEGDAQYVMAALRNLVNCDIEEIRYESFHAWPISPNTPSFKILTSASRRAKKSDISVDAFDNKSICSKSSGGSIRLKRYDSTVI